MSYYDHRVVYKGNEGAYMPRKPRSKILFDNCTTHKVWRAHNQEHYLKNNNIKKLYFDCYEKTFQEAENYQLEAFCIMDNHVHEIYKIDKVKAFSGFMRRHHSRFGQIYNIKHDRSGKVAEKRPHTTCFQRDIHAMNAIFYVHANPLQAKITKDERAYIWSTHLLYAYGKPPPCSEKIKIVFPEWYINLGKDFKTRQEKYRKLFQAYWKKARKDKGYIRYSKIYFVGEELWVYEKEEAVREYFRKENKNTS